MNVITPVVGTNVIRYADFVRITTASATYRFATTPSAITVSAVDANAFTGLSQLVSIGSATRDIKSTANETTVTLVGIDTTMLSLVLGAGIKGSKIEMWHGFFDANNNLINNLALYSQNFNNAIWSIQRGLTSITPNAATAPDGTNTATKITLSGLSDPYIGQTVNANEAIAGKTFNFSIYAWTDAGQPTSGYYLYIYDPTGTYVSTVALPVLTTTPTRYEMTYTFPIGATGNSFNIRYDPPQTPTATNYSYIWGAQAVKSNASTNYVATTSIANSGLYQYFTGFINSFSISEQWSEEIRGYAGAITVSASSIQLVLQNRTAGRYTNDNSWKSFNPTDTSMNRVNFIQTINYAFGRTPGT